MKNDIEQEAIKKARAKLRGLSSKSYVHLRNPAGR